jgi:hypothetical protein
MMDRVLEWFESSELDETADALGEILFDFPDFFTPAQKFKISKIITGPWAQDCLQALLVEPVDELPRFVRLLLAYADQSLQHFAEHPDDPLTRKLMGKCPTTCENYRLLIIFRCYAQAASKPRLRGSR